MMSRYLPLIEKQFVDESHINAIADDLKFLDLETRIYFFRELCNLTRRLPLKVFPDPEHRLKMVDAIQAALDQAIMAEDEELSP